ncbi:MAG: hypothetical protein H7644_09835 [Candidatus Heimdallarchaeota archaeon]|nr:hypothetical protein [Candidatus Heimdallarchaeota archaeon]MCK5144055.1 hypothetical protein [Candidatus Heimdallarchaeota archaeon]
MKINLDSDNEWGHFIDPDSFQIVEITDEVPDKSFVVFKEREYIDDIDRTVIQTTYGIIDGNKLQTMNKRELSKLMSKACAKYIIDFEKLPPKIMVEKKLIIDKPAQLAFILSNRDTFHLKIDKTALEGGNPYEVINSIMENQDFKLTMYDRDEKWKIEYAKSSRAKCRKCGLNIEKDTVRIGEPHYFEDHLNYRWHHEKCIFLQRFEKKNIKGLDLLEEKDRKRIEEILDS